MKAKIQGFQTVQKSWNTVSCSESYGLIKIANFSMSDIFAQADFGSVELIWYDFLRYGKILVRFSYLWYDFLSHGTILVRVGTILLSVGTIFLQKSYQIQNHTKK